MKTLPRTFTVSLRALGMAAPNLAAEVAYRLFWFLGRPARVRAADQHTHSSARVDRLRIGGKDVAVYRWGAGAKTVLLVHGWRSRASGFSAIVDALQSKNRTIIGFDAPGHGASPGSRTSILEYADIIRSLDRDVGGFDLIVAHSFGVLASFLALRQGVSTRALATIAGPYNMDYVYSVFVETLRLPPRVASKVRDKVIRRLLAGDETRWQGFESSTTELFPILVIHDEEDAEVEVDQAHRIVAAHRGQTETVVTSGFGHNRILANDRVLQRLRELASRLDT